MVTGLPPVALIAGPTASGKSALALTLAERTGGVVINADSAQLYRDLPILSAAPSPAERARTEHRLYGVRDGAEPCSAAEWAGMAKAEIAALHAEGRLPILVGGTGLYLRTLIAGIAPVPPIAPAVREELRRTSVAENFARLIILDPVGAASLHPGDTTRIARALEVALSTGKTLKAWQAEEHGGIGETIALRPLILLPPRDWLYERCDLRFAEMVDGGARREVEALAARKLDPKLPVMRAIGVTDLIALATGEKSEVEAIAAGQQATRRYAKRQYTWFVNQPPPDWPRFTEPLDSPQAIDAALALLEIES
ncbi:MAG: tRNA (adenosine(37)-N6)-dimethylallyltransferase MiaA [Sphingomicrobium sp.]